MTKQTVLTNIKNYGGWDYKTYPLRKEEAEVIVEELSQERGSATCFHCGSASVSWQSDFDFSDYSLEGEGVVHVCKCGHCGAEIEYKVRTDEDKE